VRGDLRTGHVILDPFGPKVPEDVSQQVLALKEKVLSGDFDIWAGPIVDQSGETVVAEGETLSMEAVETMDFLVEGVIGSAN
jgi:basic membrane protein A